MKYGEEYLQKNQVKENKVKIAFILGSMEPGKDGVGDYTRMLAENLLFEGIQSLIISIKETSNKVDILKNNGTLIG